MADAVASQTLSDGARAAVMKFTNISDGTGEAKVLKVDVSGLAANQNGLPCTGVSITDIVVCTEGMGVILYWDADTDVVITTLTQNSVYRLKMADFGGFTNNAGVGKTGDVLLSTVGHTSGDSYTITLKMLKNYG
tara:strand:- start:645 stop:1049 length:405 start_codon:yes stop_codon:yes gene_type:complete